MKFSKYSHNEKSILDFKNTTYLIANMICCFVVAKDLMESMDPGCTANSKQANFCV